MNRGCCLETLDERKEFILEKNSSDKNKIIDCEKNSIAGSISQRACVYCGARVVLNPITDAYHIVHGPIGCAVYTWDIRGSLSSREEVYRNSFSTDLREEDIIFGGEKKLAAAIDEIAAKHSPKLIFVYATCVVGVIGDDLEAVCKEAERKHNIKVVPVQSSGFAGNKKDGYKAACHALLLGPKVEKKKGINFLGDFNLAGEMWIVTSYLKQLGIEVNAKITGDSTFEEIKNAAKSELNIVQCAGSMTYLAKQMEKEYGIPFIDVSFYGIEDTVTSFEKVIEALGDKYNEEFLDLIKKEALETEKSLMTYKELLKDKKAAIYVGGGFKAISLIKQFNELGMKTVMVGTQTGKRNEYETIKSLVDEGTVILDDSNPSELEKFMKEKGADILVGGVKERPLAYKLGIAFCDHNHERKHPLNCFEGSINFAQEVHTSVNSPVWKSIRKELRDVHED
ncbi:nitrogenase iron-molybdenum cofactor biosynthesis protein NifE [Serpentinicella alkaliphila]|uniref:Nitrogenase iron-molybdenum cofactor biosynthesis protein NifE n=1 Tax=Serpentinicella alkaliphila TaxID=1734049 RepID=A0A4R2TJL2_9FIRM|nr:nitrogenase iron-molybdenum cofactor biosynthesis protein NifE [Serpentinicella alkaliphila]QUH24744.1 nitrogenase iron-molybdenum cofactor biosynthesis protein NifE [Serpentinicella alkaliphila]TCQ03738.1 nitrogenase molybdenum-cofactor synthesis protein NifE [Serpentinicella alkaliphila]